MTNGSLKERGETCRGGLPKGTNQIVGVEIKELFVHDGSIPSKATSNLYAA